MVHTRNMRRRMTFAGILDPVLDAYILAFLPPSLMVRSTCLAFNIATDNHREVDQRLHTVAADAVATTSLIDWAVDNGLDPYVGQRSCIRRGDVATLRLLRRHVPGIYLTLDDTTHAAGRGCLPVLQFLRQEGCPWTEFTCAVAAYEGHLEVLQWARATGCPWSARTCCCAADGGRLEVLQWARAAGCDWDATTCLAAAKGGHLETLQWARANGCAWDVATCAAAARGGHGDVLRWAHANGCPWDASTTWYAAIHHHEDLMQWALDNGCPRLTQNEDGLVSVPAMFDSDSDY